MGYMTTDGVDLNTMYYDTMIPSVDRYNQYDFYPFRETLCSDGNESYVKYPLSKITFSALGEAETPSAQKLQWGRFIGSTSKNGTAFGYTFDFLKDADTKLIALTQAAIYEADRLAIENKVLDTILDGTTAAGFWNAAYDGETDPKAYARVGAPPSYGQNAFNSNHTHYEGLNTTSIVLTHFTNAKQHIAEHKKIGALICFINSAQVETLENLAGWSSGAYIANPIVANTAIEGFQTRWLGIDFHQTEAVPAGYLVMIDPGNSTGYNKPIKFIEPNNASFRGLKLIPGNTIKDYPIIDSYFLRWMGAKVWDRSAGYVMYTGSATYTAPTLI